VIAPGPGARCWLDGAAVPVEELRIPLADPAVLAGLGLFETLAVRSGRALDLEAHLARLEAGCGRLEIAPPPAALRPLLGEAVRAAECAACGWLKIIVTAGGRWIVACGPMDPADEGRPARAVVVPWRRNPADPLSGLKSLCYAANTVGLGFARRRGADEGLWLNTRGHVAEGCASNVFAVVGGRLRTPAPGEGILPGVVRSHALAAAGRLRLAAHEGRLRRERLARASEAFLTSSLRGVRPLVALDGRPIGDGRPGPVTRRIAGEVARARLGEAGRARLDSHPPAGEV